MPPSAKRPAAFKILALTSSLLLAGWYLGFGRSWLTTRGAAEGGNSSTLPATTPATVLPSSKSGAVFRPVTFADDTQPFAPAKPAATQPPAAASDRDILLYSSKSAPVFTPDKKAPPQQQPRQPTAKP